MKKVVAGTIGKPYNGLKPNDRRKFNKGAKNGNKRRTR